MPEPMNLYDCEINTPYYKMGYLLNDNQPWAIEVIIIKKTSKRMSFVLRSGVFRERVYLNRKIYYEYDIPYFREYNNKIFLLDLYKKEDSI